MLVLWRDWIIANVFGEILGFGLAGAIMLIAADPITNLDAVAQYVAMAVAVVAMGCLEGGAVGFAQSVVLRRIFARLTRRAWLVATMCGAVVAWGFGMAVGTFAGDAFASADDTFPIAGAVVIGAGAGALLSAPQWLALRRARVRATWWIPAHAFAWSLGMVVAFAGIGAMPSSEAIVFTAIAMGGTGLGMGAVVAAITGIALVDAARVRPSRSPALP